MTEPTATPMPLEARPGATAKLRRRMLNPFLMRGFFLAKLPLALFAGLRLRELNEERCVATVPYGWRSTNPFRSTYFAALSMAAELSTGALALAAVESAPRNVAMLITGLTASFEKKATGLTTFTCTDGPRVFEAVARTIATGEPVAVEVPTVGTSPDGTVVARFTFTWSFKVRSK
jgi:acyl-coenzyme A thioesterase PaaI-like protein